MRFKEIVNSGRLNLYLFCLVVFTLPISRELFTITLWPWLLSWVIEGKFRLKFSLANLQRNKLSLLFLIGLYLITIISLIWTDNIDVGLNHIGIESSLIIFPIFLGLANSRFYTKSAFRSILLSFVSGTFIVSLFLLFKSTFNSMSILNGKLNFDPIIDQMDNIFYYSNFSTLIHPTYFGIMVLFAASICFVDLNLLLVPGKYNIGKIASGIFFLIMVFLISSRSVMIASIVLIGWLILRSFYRKKIIFISLLFIVSILIIIIFSHPRFEYLINQYNQPGTTTDETINERGLIWKSSFKIIGSNFILGVGVGDVEDALETEYTLQKYNFETTLNAHNQFIEQWMTAGILSLLLLVICLLVPVLKTIPEYKVYYISFMIINLTAFMFESTLRRFWGVAFFSIFYTLLTRKYASDSIVSTKDSSSVND